MKIFQQFAKFSFDLYLSWGFEMVRQERLLDDQMMRLMENVVLIPPRDSVHVILEWAVTDTDLPFEASILASSEDGRKLYVTWSVEMQ
jgi:hypothetical protein